MSSLLVSHTGLIDDPVAEGKRKDHWDEYHRRIDREVEPLNQAAHDSLKTAIDLGQSIVKTGTLLNGGALVAIPAVISLFGVDAKSIIWNLFVAGGLFVAGLLCSWLSAICGFFALTLRTKRYYAEAKMKRATIYRDHYLHDPSEEERIQQGRIDRLNNESLRKRRVTIVLTVITILVCFLSLATFVAGSGVAGWTILHAPSKGVVPAPANMTTDPSLRTPALAMRESHPISRGMNLQLSDEQAAALEKELTAIIDGARYFLSPRIQVLREIRNMIRPEPKREPLPEPKRYEPPRGGRYRRRG